MSSGGSSTGVMLEAPTVRMVAPFRAVDTGAARGARVACCGYHQDSCLQAATARHSGSSRKPSTGWQRQFRIGSVLVCAA
jgi:hypothetical protein